jgi:hypothetical protein
MDPVEYSTKLDELFRLVQTTSDIRAKSQLYKMYQNCKTLINELSKESVECRRLRQSTAKYSKIESEIKEAVDTFEQWVTFSKLLY